MGKLRDHLYEGMYIFTASLSDEARQKALDKIISGINQCGGEIQKIFDQGRRKLAYSIRDRKEGYYYVLYFTAPTKSISTLWDQYHLNEDLLRFVTLRAERLPDKIEFQPLPT
jgi:small subunit ribosomal protein S6